MASLPLHRHPLSLLLLSSFLPALCSAGLTIPSALLCYDQNLEQELLEGVDFPDDIASIVSELAEARESVCGWSVSATSTGEGGGRGGTSEAGPSATSGGYDGEASSTRTFSPTTSASPLQTSSLPSTSPASSFPDATSKSPSASATIPPIVSAVPSLTTTTLAPTPPPNHLLPILLGVLLPLLFLSLVALFILLRRRNRQAAENSSSYPYLADTPSQSAASSQQPFWTSLRRPKFVQMTSSSTTATVPWDPLPPRPGGSQSTLPFLAGDPDMSERRVLYLVGTNVGSPLPTPAERHHGEGEWPWEMGVDHGAGESEVELGGGRQSTMRAVEIARAESRTTRSSFESGGTAGTATGR